MADDWRQRSGITINDDSSDDVEGESSVEYRNKTAAKTILKVGFLDELERHEEEHLTDELAAKFEEYGNTPPRTRIKMKNRDWDRRQKNGNGGNSPNLTEKAPTGGPRRGMSRLARSRVQRRNTMDCAILNEMFIQEESKRSDKKTQALIRESERDFKQSMAVASATNYHARLSGNYLSGERAESMPMNSSAAIRSIQIPTLIESSNRYMSVSSRPIGYRSSAPATAFNQFGVSLPLGTNVFEAPKLHTRKEFHEMFANLIKLGSTDKQDNKLSHEDYNWQTELKDLIWLELQAWHADRSLDQQDKYLFTARQTVPDLLNQILNYRYTPKFGRAVSILSVDSGVGSESTNESGKNSCSSSSRCFGCLSMYCRDCNDQQSYALKEVEELCTRLEAAEALYPSSYAMAAFHPIYKCDSFVGRVKAMCLWYNMTRHHRLKLVILGKLLARLQGKTFHWPVQSVGPESSSNSSTHEQEESGHSSVEHETVPVKKCTNKVQFNLEGCPENPSPADSISSSEESARESSASNQSLEHTVNYSKFLNEIIISNVEPLHHITYDNVNYSTELYRKYIETVLKSRGLGKSLSFLNNLHNAVLYRAAIALEKPGAEDFESDLEFLDEEAPQIEPEFEQEQIDELRRFGVWSSEAKALNLPSYVPAFIFLSVCPIEVTHEYLRMRIENRPAKPNPLSLEQLMKELREGLTLALTYRERFNKHIHIALVDREDELEKYMGILDQFDATVKKVFELYLEYVDQRVNFAALEKNQKSVLEKEWMFTKLVAPMISGMHTMAAKKFSNIIRNLVTSIGDRLLARCAQLGDQIREGNEAPAEGKKWLLLTICRETQTLFTVERERSMKILFFAKTFCRDSEQPDFHREHYEEYCHKTNEKNLSMCPGMNELKDMKKDVLDVRNKLIEVIQIVQEKCNGHNMLELDEQDRLALLSRTREILHQGYKFGFEFNKDVMRLLEQKLIACTDEQCQASMALGIITFAKMWMQFVTERCERGRGVRPRWASQGLEFLILACDPQNTRHLNDKEFEELKKKMDACISHVIGIISEPEKTKKKASPRTRKSSSPAVSRSRTPTRTPLSAGIILNPQQKFLHPQLSLKEDQSTGISESSSGIDSPDFMRKADDFQNITLVVPRGNSYSPALRQIRVRDAVNQLDMQLENKLRERNLIGQVKTLNVTDNMHIRARSVNFRWHRGIKIGQGRFGKVYTAVNNSTGELMAMKEILIQPGETRGIKKVAEELKILEGISHKHLVKYYGVEIHREELLIFMELCSEGTLESLVELSGGLYEGLTRRFTAQLLSGVAELHKHGIVHRDIKSANIFLVNGGNCLKLGDFGSAVKIQSHTTVPGELQGYVGTQAYMAPEVFTKTNSDGHGRAADIWSVGCVVIEMASGKRPWSQFDSNFQIMFKVGMGETPEIPETLSQEGCEFLEHCLQHDPKKRLTAMDLRQHNFCKVGIEDECCKSKIPETPTLSRRKNKT